MKKIIIGDHTYDVADKVHFLIEDLVEKNDRLRKRAYAEGYREGYGNGYLEAGGKGLMDENGPVKKVSQKFI